MTYKDFLWFLAAFVALLTFAVVMALASEGRCNNGYVYIDDERGKGCIPWEAPE